jgi:hypothetical protein
MRVNSAKALFNYPLSLKTGGQKMIAGFFWDCNLP